MTVYSFRPGDRLALSPHGRASYPTLRNVTGTYLHPARDTVRLVVHRDGVKKPEIWSASYWDLVPKESGRSTVAVPHVPPSVPASKVMLNVRLPGSLVDRLKEKAKEQERTVTSLIRSAVELSLELGARVAAGERVVCEHPETGERTRMLVPGS